MWCTAILQAHGQTCTLAEHTWQSTDPVPLYYSNLVTRNATPAGTRAQRAAVRALAAHPPKPDWSLKDSFAAFDAAEMHALGLEPLFDAVWYGSPATSGALDGDTVQRETDLVFERVPNARTLQQWEANWQYTSPTPHIGTFPATLLLDDAIAFYTARREGVLVGGLAINRSPGAVGISNVFSRDGDAMPMLRDAIRTLRHPDDSDAWVGYGPPAEVSELASLGFRALGPLRIWIARA